MENSKVQLFKLDFLRNNNECNLSLKGGDFYNNVCIRTNVCIWRKWSIINQVVNKKRPLQWKN